MRWRKGFTMIELSIVIVIVIILAATAIPRFVRTISMSQVETASKQVATAMRFARQTAITAKANMKVVAAPGWNKVCVVNDATQDTLYRFGFSGTTTVISLTGMPVFHPRGTSVGATIHVGDGSRSKDVIVNVVARVRIQDHI